MQPKDMANGAGPNQATKYLFVGGPHHSSMVPVANPGATVTETSTGTVYVPMKFTHNAPHPITGQQVPTFERLAFVEQQLAGNNELLPAAMQDAVVVAWFRDGDPAPQPGAVIAPPVEYEATCAEDGPACFHYRNASKARVATQAAQHNQSTGHRIAVIVERYPEPEAPETPATVEGDTTQ